MTQQISALPASAFVPLDELDELSGVLGVINYTSGAGDPDISPGHLRFDLHMAHGTAEGFAEVWTTDRPVETGESGGIGYAHDGEHLLCAGRVPPSERYAEATRAAYTAMLELMESLGYQRCARMWNFVNDINADNADGLEVYRDFCLGRAEAFEARDFSDTSVPAATGIGSLGGGISFYVLASRTNALTPIENSKQVSAYNYPERYGPRPPKFARATYLSATEDRAAGQLYVSGTSSIRGHETLFAGDVEKQTLLALENIAHLVGSETAADYRIEQHNTLADLDTIKVYVRHREDIPAVRRICEEHFSPDAQVAYLNVDVCRADLSVELEGIVHAPRNEP
ncbi:FkbO/Hyg5 family chorismatase [Saccharopolyspora sp. TS4A08]|uniref:FkbO/Hyg5 family chorismatase n=1 Tax=Saccharopolyspora ipomoeae TaxID=3042027 RepID=A0ABT6PWS9_9PSEU|nr:FkbO/Hyg5 family chorismatase [Saccharopolyspora sp. TS4A08]MDI2032310.1 FkbO/Hyg5 family chorismatase [Saccharopolyspora sp. TS4A08]